MLGFCAVEVYELGPVQLYVAEGTVVWVRDNVWPEHTGLFEPGVKIDGGGVFTTTFTVLVGLVHPFTVMLSEYVPAFAEVAFETLVVWVLAVKPPGPLHEYTAPLTALVVKLIVPFRQTGLFVETVGVAGMGLTVTVAVIGIPGHPVAEGVIVYTAVPGVVVVVVSVCVIVVPDPADAPLTPVCPTVQEKVVPVTLLVSAIEVALPEHRACVDGVAVTVGAGLTVTVTTAGVPVQPPAVGVIV